MPRISDNVVAFESRGCGDTKQVGSDRKAEGMRGKGFAAGLVRGQTWARWADMSPQGLDKQAWQREGDCTGEAGGGSAAGSEPELWLVPSRSPSGWRRLCSLGSEGLPAGCQCLLPDSQPSALGACQHWPSHPACDCLSCDHK